MKRLFVLALGAACLTSLALPAVAAPPKAAKVKPPTIKKVDVAAGEVTINTGVKAAIKYDNGQGNRRVYKVTPETTITLNGLAATLDELEPGMIAEVRVGMDAAKAAAITASLPPLELEKIKRRRKEKKAVSLVPGEIGRDEVIAIDAQKITVGRKGGSEVLSYRITGDTKVLFNDQPGEVSAIQAKMPVIVVQGMDPTTAATIRVSGGAVPLPAASKPK